MRQQRLNLMSSWQGAAFVLLAILAPARPAPAQEIYKSVDAAGHVSYSDRGTSKNSPKTSLKVEEGDPAEAARIAKEQQLLKAEDAQRTRQDALDARNKADEDRQREAACRNARNNYFRVKDANRLFKLDAEGNRVYYSDEEADKMRVQAQRAMTSACAG
jgi:multidrug efflux pump subunit AcrA (membrane-fusion protein)